VKNANDINSFQVEDARLPKSKSYLKIIGILFYPHLNSQEKLTSANIKTILWQNHIFNNISLVLKPRIIKVCPKSDIVIVWIDIWNVQSRHNAKMLINRCFNVGNYIATIRGANMNSGIHVCSSDGSDIVADIEASVYKHFSIMSALNVPYIYPDNYYIGLWTNFDYSWF